MRMRSYDNCMIIIVSEHGTCQSSLHTTNSFSMCMAVAGIIIISTLDKCNIFIAEESKFLKSFMDVSCKSAFVEGFQILTCFSRCSESQFEEKTHVPFV